MKGIMAILIGGFIAIVLVATLSTDIASEIDDIAITTPLSDISYFDGLPEVLSLLPLLFVAVPVIGLARLMS